MGKFKGKGTVNTYGKKRTTKIKVTNVNILNVTNHFTVVNNYFNIIKSPSRERTFENQSKENICDLTKYQTSSTSASGDEFDQVLKGPIYNAPCKPCTSSSGDEFDQLLKGPFHNVPCSLNSQSPHSGRKYLWKRQNTINSYCSDASSIKSDLSSVHLFKDCSSSSCLYSPLNILQSNCQTKNNKWIVTSSTNSKKKNCVYKKKIRRKISICSSTNRKIRSENTMSSTPTHSDSKKWVEPHVSPILPPTSVTFNHNQSVADMFENVDSDDEAKQPQPTMGISALAQQFDDLWRAPCNDNNSDDHIDSRAEESELKEIEYSQIIPTINKTNNSIQEYTKGLTYNDNKKIDHSKVFSNEMLFSVLQEENDSDYFEHKKDLCHTSTQDNGEHSLTHKVNHLGKNLTNNDINKGLKLHNLCCQNKTDSEKNSLLYCYNKSFHGFNLSDYNKPLVHKSLHWSIKDDVRIAGKDMDNKENSLIVTNSNIIQNCGTEEQQSNTSVSVLNLTPGKQWKRSFLKRKQSELKRSSIGPSIIAKLMRDEACSSRHSYASSRCLNKQNDLTQNIVNEESCIVSSEMPSSFLIPNSPEIMNISFRGKGKHRKNLYCDNSNNMERILEESYSDDQHSLSNSRKNSIELKVDARLPNDKISFFSINNQKASEGCNPCGHNSDNCSVACSSVEPFIFPNGPEDFYPSDDKSSLNKTYKIYSNDNYKASNTNYDFSKNDISNISSSFNETCPLIKMAGLLNTITKRKKPQLERSLCDEEYALFKDLEYSFFDEKYELPNGSPTDCVLMICHQDIPLLFADVFSEIALTNSEKIGEGVYGEVFMLSGPDNQRSVLKIIPVEGSRLVNNERQKKFEEVLSELIITQELSLLRENEKFRTSGFCLLKNLYCLKGEYPPILIKHWEKFNRENKSYNDCPDIFDCQQLYIALELDHAGEPLESFIFSSAKEAYSIFLQIAFSLATAEMALEFEHRDLHIGNVLLSRTTDEYVDFTHDGRLIKLPTYELKATIIDFTLSRISFKCDVLYCDLATDPELFTADGDYQFEVYRLMRNDVNNRWNIHAPFTNIRWLYYLADKLIQSKYSCKKSLRLHTQYLKKIKNMKRMVEDFPSSSEFINSLMKTEIIIQKPDQ